MVNPQIPVLTNNKGANGNTRKNLVFTVSQFERRCH
jgi:hypothetical protein